MFSKQEDFDELDTTWRENPDLILSFLKMRPQYEQLCSEIAYILTKRLREQNIEHSAITNRAKTLKSFCEKISRKDYENPLKDITDFAGVRVVYLYKNDRNAIEQIIESEFKVIEKVDKIEAQEVDRFGYGALHYLVNLGRKSSGARYDDLKGLVCEIQVRTVLQDAWAIIDHHLIYKKESDIPKVLRRKINSLSGLFETADDQFERIRFDREEYRDTVKSKLGNDNFLQQEINLETFTEYLNWKFPKIMIAINEERLSRILSTLVSLNYKTLNDLEKLLTRTEKARKSINAERPIIAGTGEVACAIALTNTEYRSSNRISPATRKTIENYLKLVS